VTNESRFQFCLTASRRLRRVSAADRSSADATYDDKNLALEITSTSGKPSRLSSALLHPLNQPPPNVDEFAPKTCRIFFDFPPYLFLLI
jgi:hypothetical protein